MATIAEALAIAIQHHKDGRLQAAEQIYEQILAVEPNHFVARGSLGLVFKAQGKLDEAAASYRRALELKPDSALLYNYLGNALKEQGKLDEAVISYGKAVQLEPDHFEAHRSLGNVLKEQGKLHEAAASYRRALELKPDSAPLHNNLGNTLRNLGRFDEAVACYRRAVELAPRLADSHYNLGIGLADQGKTDEAVACYRRALELKPDHAAAYNNLGIVLRDQGKTDEAVACYRLALALRPDDAEVQSNLGIALHGQGKLDEAITCYRRALELRPDDAKAYTSLGIALNDQGKLDEAVACYHRALKVRPDYAEAHSNLGIVREEVGDLQGAEECFRAALRQNSRFAYAHHKLAALLGGRLPEKDIAAQLELLAESTTSGAERLLLHFGLAQVLDARGEYAAAAAHLDQGNSLWLAELRTRGQEYDTQEYHRFVDEMIAVCGPDFFRRTHGFGLESELPVFIVGLPRSGTTLIEQILASHSQVFGAGEIKLAPETLAALGRQGPSSLDGLRNLDRPTAQRLASQHLERLRTLNPAALRIVDKMPENYLLLGLLACLFPRAKVIHCRRDLRDVAVSCWMTHFREVRWTNDQEHIASRFYEYQRIMEHWRRVLPVPILDVDYEETVADLESVARRLVAWCGLEWEPRCLDFHQAKRTVSTASAAQVRQPVHKQSVGRWKHYEQALAKLLARLESMVAQ